MKIAGMSCSKPMLVRIVAMWITNWVTTFLEEILLNLIRRPIFFPQDFLQRKWFDCSQITYTRLDLGSGIC